MSPGEGSGHRRRRESPGARPRGGDQASEDEAGPRGHGHGGPWDVGPGFGGGRRRRRGDIRLALLAALAEGEAHGYGLMRLLEERSAGLWRPSAGSVYPTLQLLEDEGLVDGHDEHGRRVFTLTEDGRTAAGRVGERGPWRRADGPEGPDRRGLHEAVRQLEMAARQVGTAGTDEQIDRARDMVLEACSGLYRLLAGDLPPTSPVRPSDR